MTAASALLSATLVAAAALAAGRAFVGAFGGRLYRRLDAAGAAASLAAGTAVLTLLSVGLSGAGFPTRSLPPLIGALLLAATALAARRARLDVWRPRGDAREWVSLLLPVVATLGLGLLPVMRTGGFWFGNDTYTYCAFGEWLQEHGYSEPARWEAQSPVTGIPALYQSQGYDLGIAHWLALVQASLRPASALLVYPQVSSFGLALLAAVVWLSARQLLRLGRLGSFAAASAFALVPHALYWGHHNGFLQQGYALPLVLYGVVLLARTTPASSWNASSAALLALPFAFLASVYLPLAPLLGSAAVAAWAPLAARAWRRGRARHLFVFGLCFVGCVALYAWRDVAGALSPLHRFANSVVGGHVPLSATGFFRFALGSRVLAPGWVDVESWPWSPLNAALSPIYGVLVLAGLGLAARRPRTRPLAAAAGLLLLAAVYFALAVEDPWSGRVGHTWNLFKLAQWAWPFTLLLGAFAVSRLAPRRPRARMLAAGLAALLPASQVGAHLQWSTRLGEETRTMLPGTGLDGLASLKRRIQDLPPGTLLVVGRPVNANRWLATAVSLVAWPRAIVADWSDSASVSNHPVGGAELYEQLLERWDAPHVTPLLAGFLPFQATGVEELGAGFARLLRQPTPVLVHVVNPSGIDQDTASGRATFVMGVGRTKIVVFSPTARAAEMELTLQSYPARLGTRLVVFQAEGDYSHRSVRLASESAPSATVPLHGETALLVPLELPRGLSTVVLAVDDGRGTLNAQQPVTVLRVQIRPAGE